MPNPAEVHTHGIHSLHNTFTKCQQLQRPPAQVRRVPVATQRAALAELRVRPAKTEALRSVEASLRLDAVASAGFRMSRAKAADLVKAGDIRWGAAHSARKP